MLCFYHHGLLNPDPAGNVTLAELDAALMKVGIHERLRSLLKKQADKTDDIPESFNLFELRGSNLDHTGSTGIRDPEVDVEKLQTRLLNFSVQGRMYAEHFAAAANFSQQHERGLHGTTLQTVELTSILKVFGRHDESGRLFLTNDDLRSIWIDGRIPADWQPRPEGDIGLLDVFGSSITMAGSRLLKFLGL
ncbi:MAG: hypothetical protein ACKPEY_17615 [Planctomycetota bacterium]